MTLGGDYFYYFYYFEFHIQIEKTGEGILSGGLYPKIPDKTE